MSRHVSCVFRIQQQYQSFPVWGYALKDRIGMWGDGTGYLPQEVFTLTVTGEGPPTHPFLPPPPTALTRQHLK